MFKTSSKKNCAQKQQLKNKLIDSHQQALQGETCKETHMQEMGDREKGGVTSRTILGAATAETATNKLKPPRASGGTSAEREIAPTSFFVQCKEIVRKTPKQCQATSLQKKILFSCQKSGAKKDPQGQRIAQTAPKNFLNSSRWLPVITQQKQGFEANHTRKCTRMFGKNLGITQFLCDKDFLFCLQ